MKVFNFERYFPVEESSRLRFRKSRLTQGIVRPKCECMHHYWKSDKGMFQSGDALVSLLYGQYWISVLNLQKGCCVITFYRVNAR